MCFSFLQYLVQYSVTWAWACHSVWISWVCEVLTVFPQVLQCMTLFTNFWLPDIIFKERKESKCQFPLLPLKIVMNISCQGERLSSSFFVHKRNMTCTDIDHAQGMHDQLRINLDPLAKLKRWSTAVRCLGRKRPLITDKQTNFCGDVIAVFCLDLHAKDKGHRSKQKIIRVPWIFQKT